MGKPKSKWGDLGRLVAKLKDGESILLERRGDLVEEARRIRNGLNGIRACTLVRRAVKVVDGKIIFGLLACVIFSTANLDQRVPDGYHLTFAGKELPTKEWWGRASDFLTLAAAENLPQVKLDFSS